MGTQKKLLTWGSAGLSRFWNFGTARNSNLFRRFHAQLDQAERLIWRFLSEKHPTPTELKQLPPPTRKGIPATDKIFLGWKRLWTRIEIAELRAQLTKRIVILQVILNS